MSQADDTLLLKGIAADLIEPIWKAEFYNDAEDYIIYEDPDQKKNHRSENEIEQISSELFRLRNDLIDEIVEDLIAANITKIEDVMRSHTRVRKICHKGFAKYRRRLWNVIKPELPAE